MPTEVTKNGFLLQKVTPKMLLLCQKMLLLCPFTCLWNYKISHTGHNTHTHHINMLKNVQNKIKHA